MGLLSTRRVVQRSFWARQVGIRLRIFGRPVMEKKIIIFYAWIISLVTVAFFVHEFAYTDGAMDERQANKVKLTSCQELVARNLYAKDGK
jgi:Tfp pilus assembly protein PilN